MTQETELEDKIAALAAKYPFIPENLISRAASELMNDYGYDFEEVEASFGNNFHKICFLGTYKTWEDYVQIRASEEYDILAQEWERLSTYFDFEKYGNDIKQDVICITGYEGVAIFYIR